MIKIDEQELYNIDWDDEGEDKYRETLLLLLLKIAEAIESVERSQ